MSDWEILRGDCKVRLKDLPDASVDAVVTDTPYELGFMGKAWDATGIANDVAMWREVLRVLKPGGHLVAFGGSRTYHRMACAVEDAGFEIRDCLQWLYGTGFPKSLDVSKAIDKGAGFSRATEYVPNLANNTFGRGLGGGAHNAPSEPPVTAAAAAWSGWGTALKPGYEPIVLARKPLAGTVAASVQAHGTGALNIDGCRIAHDASVNLDAVQNCRTEQSGDTVTLNIPGHSQATYSPAGRWPANVLLDEEAAKMLDATADASRFFYCAKASKGEREAGLEAFPKKSAGELTEREDGTDGLNSPRAGAGRTGGRANVHPTVKPLSLMRWLCRLITPPGGVVLDPFTGSGSTGCAAVLEGFDFLGIEREEEYARIAEARIAHWKGKAA